MFAFVKGIEVNNLIRKKFNPKFKKNIRRLYKWWIY